MAEGWRIAVVGATGWLGGEVVEALRLSPLPVGELVAMGSPASAGKSVEWGELRVPVQRLDPERLEEVDAIFVAAPPQAVAEDLAAVRGQGPLLVDLVGLHADDPAVPLVALGINPGLLDEVRETGVVRVPGPVSLALTAILRPLGARAALAGVHGVALRPASTRGREAVEELSQQVMALFNQREPRRVVFPDGLAFDVLPGDGQDGWSDDERRVGEELAVLVGIDSRGVAISEVILPVFTGMGLEVELIAMDRLTVDDVAACLEEAPGVELATGRPQRWMLRGRVGSPVVQVGRLRQDPSGRTVHLWASTDPTRLVAANAVATAAAVLQGAS